MISFFYKLSRLCVHCALSILESAINFKIQTPQKRKINEKKRREREILATKFNTFGAATTTSSELINSFDEMIKIKSLRTENPSRCRLLCPLTNSNLKCKDCVTTLR